MTPYFLKRNQIDFDFDEDFEQPYEILREALAPKYRNLPPRDIERILEHSFLGSVSPEDAENFFRDLGRFASQAAPVVGQVASAALPVVGTVVGTAVGGPVGGALGGALGSAAGGAIGSANVPRLQRVTQTPQPKPPVQRATQVSQPSPRPVAPVYGPQPHRPSFVQQPAVQPQTLAPATAAQLLATIFQPQVLQALLAMVMGSAGRQTIAVGDNLVPLGAFANLIGTLANQAAAQYNAVTQEAGENIPQYLMDFNGEFLVDPAVPEQRAGLLMNLLQQANQENLAPKVVKSKDVNRYRQQNLRITEVDEMYDALEIEELYSLESWEED
ncbi:MAG: hypothetical protein IGS39_00445 [Calothrix sp. C42_A2020_038]|nr:hypothetical protein [Calothrix sp. C42_A2020_038]